MKVDAREMKVLRELCLGNIEDEAHFAFVGRKTFDGMLAKGWIVRAYDETYGVDGYKLTLLGEEVHEEAWKRGVRPR